MCADRQHKYRMTYQLGSAPEKEILIYAKGLPEAFAKLDGWCAANHPDEWVTMSSHRTPLTLEQAVAHGAIAPGSLRSGL